MTKLEQYLYFLKESSEEQPILNKQKFIETYHLNDKEELNRLKVVKWILSPLFILIPFIIYALGMDNMEMFELSVSLVFSVLISAFITFIIVGSIEKLKEKWIKKEWEEYTGLKYKHVVYSPEIVVSSVEHFMLMSDPKISKFDFMERIKHKPEGYQREFLRKIMKKEGF